MESSSRSVREPFHETRNLVLKGYDFQMLRSRVRVHQAAFYILRSLSLVSGRLSTIGIGVGGDHYTTPISTWDMTLPSKVMNAFRNRKRGITYEFEN